MLNASSEHWLAGVSADKFGLLCKSPFLPPLHHRQSLLLPFRVLSSWPSLCGRVRSVITQPAAGVPLPSSASAGSGKVPAAPGPPLLAEGAEGRAIRGARVQVLLFLRSLGWLKRGGRIAPVIES